MIYNIKTQGKRTLVFLYDKLNMIHTVWYIRSYHDSVGLINYRNWNSCGPSRSEARTKGGGIMVSRNHEFDHMGRPMRHWYGKLFVKTLAAILEKEEE